MRGTSVYYLVSSTSTESSSSAEVCVGKRDRLHPAVKYLDRRSTSVNARFRSMSARTIDLYFDDGGDGIPQGTLHSGQDTTTSAYEGHVFYYTPHQDKDSILGSVTMDKNQVRVFMKLINFQTHAAYILQVLYRLTDEEYPASKDIFDYTDEEEAYMADYLNRTGLHWRSFYGRNGPRPPPTHFMWPADEIGQVHVVNSSHGKWY